MKQKISWSYPSSRYIVNDRWLKLRADQAVAPDGAIINDLYITEHKDWANCLVIMDDQAIMLEHYRHGIRSTVLELVGGHIEPDDPDPAAGMRRELQEELGLNCSELFLVGQSYANPANQTNMVYSYLSVGGRLAGDTATENEYFDITKLPLDQLSTLLKNGERPFQALHLANIFLSFQFIASYDGSNADIHDLKSAVAQHFA